MLPERLLKFSNGKEYYVAKMNWSGIDKWVAVEIEDEITREMFKFGHNYNLYTNRSSKGRTRGTK